MSSVTILPNNIKERKKIMWYVSNIWLASDVVNSNFFNLKQQFSLFRTQLPFCFFLSYILPSYFFNHCSNFKSFLGPKKSRKSTLQIGITRFPFLVFICFDYERQPMIEKYHQSD